MQKLTKTGCGTFWARWIIRPKWRSYSKNLKVSYKFLGIYFVIEVKHIFDKNTYFNELVCVKTYNFKDLGYDTKTI